jgi:hypothetical protein
MKIHDYFKNGSKYRVIKDIATLPTDSKIIKVGSVYKFNDIAYDRWSDEWVFWFAEEGGEMVMFHIVGTQKEADFDQYFEEVL